MKIAVLVAALLVASCATQKPASSYCDIARPLRLSEAAIDAMSDAEARDVLAHNRKGEALCAWKP